MTLHNLLVALILLRALTLDFASPVRRNRQLALLLALVGFGLTHHRTTLLLVLGLAVYLVWRQPALLRPQRVWLLWRLVDSQQKVLALADGTPAANDATPLRQVARTPTWAPETPVRDVYEVRLPTANADAHLLLILYDAHTLQEAGRLQMALP